MATFLTEGGRRASGGSCAVGPQRPGVGPATGELATTNLGHSAAQAARDKLVENGP